MAEKRQVNVAAAVLLLFVFVMPVFASSFENAALYTAVAVFSAAVGYMIYKTGFIIVSKAFLFLLGIFLFSALQLFFVSDKGNHAALSAVFLLGALSCLLISNVKNEAGFGSVAARVPNVIYSASLLYAVMAVLCQIFIESSILGSMDFQNGSKTFAACFMAIGIICSLAIHKKKRKRTGFFLGMAFLIYVFVMSRSLLGYLFLAAVVLFFTISRKKRVEGFFALIATAVLGAVNIIIAVADVIQNPEPFNGAMAGAVRIFGIGSGGYNASVSVLGKGYEFSQVGNLLIEAFGIFGFVIMLLWLAGAFYWYIRSRKTSAMLMLLFSLTVIFSSSVMQFAVPVIGMYYAFYEEGAPIRIGKITGAVLLLPCVLSAIWAFANVPYAIAKDAWDTGAFEKSADYYAAGAKMEMINAEPWERAFAASSNAFGAEGKTEYINNAIKLNEKNYKYMVYKADALEKSGDYIGSMNIWDDIILRHDKEQLYPMYVNKIANVMENCPIGLEEMERLYKKIEEYSLKATDKEIIKQVNDIFTKSQQYYVRLREGDTVKTDIYNFTEQTAEAEYESGTAES